MRPGRDLGTAGTLRVPIIHPCWSGSVSRRLPVSVPVAVPAVLAVPAVPVLRLVQARRPRRRCRPCSVCPRPRSTVARAPRTT
jgi:hypothetical protein